MVSTVSGSVTARAKCFGSFCCLTGAAGIRSAEEISPMWLAECGVGFWFWLCCVQGSDDGCWRCLLVLDSPPSEMVQAPSEIAGVGWVFWPPSEMRQYW
jgi:hypothetical protein